MIYRFEVVNGATQEEANDLDVDAPLLTDDFATANKKEMCLFSCCHLSRFDLDPVVCLFPLALSLLH